MRIGSHYIFGNEDHTSMREYSDKMLFSVRTIIGDGLVQGYSPAVNLQRGLKPGSKLLDHVILSKVGMKLGSN